jgi:hypothetical protein
MLILQGMSAIWLTLNPSDLHSLLALIPASVAVSLIESPPIATAAVRRISTTSNSVAVARFFHYIWEAFFGDLLRSGLDDLGIFCWPLWRGGD